MTITDWPPRPPDRVRHRWSCTRRGPLLETVKTDVLGQAHVVSMCQECGGDDMAERMRAEREATPRPAGEPPRRNKEGTPQ